MLSLLRIVIGFQVSSVTYRVGEMARKPNALVDSLSPMPGIHVVEGEPTQVSCSLISTHVL